MRRPFVYSLFFPVLPAVLAIPALIGVWTGWSPLSSRSVLIDWIKWTLLMAGLVGVVWFSALILWLKDRLVERAKPK
jgi:hypothetical protein